jgi:hypothetical protein
VTNNQRRYIEHVNLKAQHGGAEILMPTQRIGVRPEKGSK